jgi:methanogenic corrinoid protein MtbC1
MNVLYKQTSQTIIDKLDDLARVSVDRQYALQPDTWVSFGKAGYAKSIRDAGYHFSYLAESLAVNDASLFLDYAAWAKVLFAGLNFPPQALTTALECMGGAIHETLQGDTAALACSTIDAALEHLSHISENIDSFISPESPQADLAKKFLDVLLQGDRHTASQIILDSVTHGTSVKDIYLHVFQPCQQEIGRLWQMNRISVAQEHFCTVATQMVMSQLYPYIFTTKKSGRCLVATSVGSELHEIGMRMVADFLEMEGWDTYYLGANTPNEAILHTLEERQAHVLAISATISFNVSKVAELIDRVRGSTSCPSVKILVGGYPFNIAKDLWQKVGADGYARNAQEAIPAADQLLVEPL